MQYIATWAFPTSPVQVIPKDYGCDSLLVSSQHCTYSNPRRELLSQTTLDGGRLSVDLSTGPGQMVAQLQLWLWIQGLKPELNSCLLWAMIACLAGEGAHS